MCSLLACGACHCLHFALVQTPPYCEAKLPILLRHHRLVADLMTRIDEILPILLRHHRLVADLMTRIDEILFSNCRLIIYAMLVCKHPW